MGELAGFGTAPWLPGRVQRAQLAEDRAEAREAREAEATRAEKAEAARERAVGAYREQAEARGDHISALQLAAGDNIGRSVADVLADAAAVADREDARATARDRREELAYVGEPRIQASRSAWPESEYALSRQLRRADELHRDLVAMRARHNYPAAEEAARAKREAVRSQIGHGVADSGEITRTAMIEWR